MGKQETGGALHDKLLGGGLLALGLLMTWTLVTTNMSDKKVGEVGSAVASDKKEHIAEVKRSTDKDDSQEAKLAKIHDILFDFNRELGEIKKSIQYLEKRP